MTEAMTTTLMRGCGRQDKDGVGEMGGREEGVGVGGVRTGMHHMALLPGSGEGGNGKTTGIWDMAGGAEDCSAGENLSGSFIQGSSLGIQRYALSFPQSKPTTEGFGGTLDPPL